MQQQLHPSSQQDLDTWLIVPQLEHFTLQEHESGQEHDDSSQQQHESEQQQQSEHPSKQQSLVFKVSTLFSNFAILQQRNDWYLDISLIAFVKSDDESKFNPFIYPST